MMSYVGRAYKTDVRLAIGGSNNSSLSLKRLEEKGYVIEEKVLCKDDTHRPAAPVISLTPRGRIYLSDKTNDDDYHQKYFKEITAPRFSSSDMEKVHRELGISRIMLFLNSAGVRVFSKDKPSLPKLQSLTKNTVYTENTFDKFYNNDLPVEDLLSDGVFYTKKEISTFFDTEELFDEDDIANGTRIKGVYFDCYRTCVVLQPNIFKSRTIKFSASIESRTLASIKERLPILRLNQVANYDAIVLTNSSALIVDMAIGGKDGKVNRNQTNGNKKGERFLNYATGIYNNIYCFPNDLVGIKSFAYFRNFQSNQEIYDAREQGGCPEGFSLIPRDNYKNQDFLFLDERSPRKNLVAFFPYYDLKRLHRIRNYNQPISIITQEAMADKISHILRRSDLSFYAPDGTPLEISAYQESGLKVGTPEPEYKKKHYRPAHSKVHVELPNKLINTLKTNAKLNGISMSAYIRQLLSSAVFDETNKNNELASLQKTVDDLSKKAYTLKPLE